MAGRLPSPTMPPTSQQSYATFVSALGLLALVVALVGATLASRSDVTVTLAQQHGALAGSARPHAFPGGRPDAVAAVASPAPAAGGSEQLRDPERGDDRQQSARPLCDEPAPRMATPRSGSDWTGDRSRWYCALQTDSGPTYGALDPAAPPGTAPVAQCHEHTPVEPSRSKSSLRARKLQRHQRMDGICELPGASVHTFGSRGKRPFRNPMSRARRSPSEQAPPPYAETCPPGGVVKRRRPLPEPRASGVSRRSPSAW
jgi:hypothetical protein